jgi:hypothetical protein
VPAAVKVTAVEAAVALAICTDAGPLARLQT